MCNSCVELVQLTKNVFAFTIPATFCFTENPLSALEYFAMVHPIMDHAQTVWDTGITSTFNMFQSFIDPTQAKCIQYIPFSRLTWQWTTGGSKLFNPQIQNW